MVFGAQLWICVHAAHVQAGRSTCRMPPLGALRIADWLEKGMLQRLVLVITSTMTKEVLERWTFEVETNAQALEGR